MRLKFNPLFIYLFLTALFAFVPLAATAAELKQVLILPFTINAEKDLAYLNRGMVAMLSSRLYHQDHVTTLTGEANAPNQAAALKLGADSGADFVVFGSITVFGKSVSTDLQLVNVENETTVLTFSEAGTKKGAVISHIDQFALKVNALLQRSEKVDAALQRIEPAPVAAPAAQPVTVAPVPVVVAPPPTAASPVAPAAPAAIPPVAAATQTAATKTIFWQGDEFEYKIRGMVAADLDGDGRIEIACIDKHNVYIYRLNEKGIDKVTEVKNRKYNLLISIAAADINANGYPEIFVTAVNPAPKPGDTSKNQLFSFVVEWDGHAYRKIADNLNSYFQTIALPDGKPALVGQARGMSDIFVPGIHVLKWTGSTYVKERELEIARTQNVFGFTYGEALNDGKVMLAAFDRLDYLRLMNAHGKKKWVSGSRYGGSAIFLEEFTHDSFSEGQLEERERIYLPNRLFIQDLDRDGQQEIILIENHQKGTGVFHRLKNFASGQAQVLFWHRTGMKTRWSSDEISGFLSDIAVADMNGDGHDEIIYAIVKGKRSYLVAETPTLTELPAK